MPHTINQDLIELAIGLVSFCPTPDSVLVYNDSDKECVTGYLWRWNRTDSNDYVAIGVRLAKPETQRQKINGVVKLEVPLEQLYIASYCYGGAQSLGGRETFVITFDAAPQSSQPTPVHGLRAPLIAARSTPVLQ